MVSKNGEAEKSSEMSRITRLINNGTRAEIYALLFPNTMLLYIGQNSRKFTELLLVQVFLKITEFL